MAFMVETHQFVKIPSHSDSFLSIIAAILTIVTMPICFTTLTIFYVTYEAFKLFGTGHQNCGFRYLSKWDFYLFQAM